MPGVEGRAIGHDLDTRVVGRLIEVHREIDSTNLQALRRAREGAPEGLVVLAHTQSAGRARLGRTWSDVPGRCLLFSVLLGPPAGVEGLLTAAAALAVAEAVREQLGLEAGIKWPNDVVLEGRKFAGVLAERPQGKLAAVGVGVNVNGSLDDLPEDLRETATFLSAHAGAEINLADLLRAILRRLDEDYLALREGNMTAIVKRAEELDRVVGREVRLTAEGRSICGTAVGWAPTGALKLRDGAGSLHEFEAGVVTLH